MPLPILVKKEVTMQKLRTCAKPISYLLVVCLLAVGTYIPAARAGIIGTEQIVNAARAHVQRERIHSLLSRKEVKAYLSARGVDAAELNARVDSLTDQEVDTLASRLDHMPAGGDIVVVALIVFLVLLITDLLGLTDIFPFVKHKKAH
jgi:hypothetical protein